jgi:hypothetical protein
VPLRTNTNGKEDPEIPKDSLKPSNIIGKTLNPKCYNSFANL